MGIINLNLLWYKQRLSLSEMPWSNTLKETPLKLSLSFRKLTRRMKRLYSLVEASRSKSVSILKPSKDCLASRVDSTALTCSEWRNFTLESTARPKPTLTEQWSYLRLLKREKLTSPTRSSCSEEKR